LNFGKTNLNGKQSMSNKKKINIHYHPQTTTVIIDVANVWFTHCKIITGKDLVLKIAPGIPPPNFFIP